MLPKLTVSGYRGIWEETITEDIAAHFAWAFAKFVQKRKGYRIFIGRDARISGDKIIHAVSHALRDAGIEVTIGGILPTPTILYLVRTLGYDGAIIVTASHNPAQYNGLKFATSFGMFTNESEVEELKVYLKQTKYEKKEGGSIKYDLDLGIKHVEHILKNCDVHLIREKNFRVILDPINSAGSELGAELLKRLGCEVFVINADMDGIFEHEPEPLPINLDGLGEEVEKMKADIGFALDPDADRLVVCDETGMVIFEEYTLSLAILSVLHKKPGDIVVNMSTSRTNEDIARDYGGKTFRTKVGEANVVKGIKQHRAVIGGEGSGGIIYPSINPCRDGLTGMALILELLAGTNKTVSEIVEKLPYYAMRKNKFPYSGELEPLYKKMHAMFPEATRDTLDGLRLDFPDGAWIHLRPSNTEPIVRLMGEAKTEERIDGLINQIRSLF